MTDDQIEHGMEQMHIAPLDGETAQRLADLGSIHQDLQFVMDCCERLQPLLHTDDADSVVVEALWSAALIAYSRCFAQGKRLGLSQKDIEDLPGNPLAFHQFVRDMRDKRIAHSVNPFEQIKVGAVLPPADSEDDGVQGIATLAMRYISATEEGVSGLWELARTLRRRVGALAKAAQEDLLEEARKLDPAILYERPNLGTHAPSPEQAGTARP